MEFNKDLEFTLGLMVKNMLVKFKQIKEMEGVL